jgi:hypothetical protein
MDIGANIRNFTKKTYFLEDRAKIELAFEEWRVKQVPVARNSVQSFIVFLRQNDLWDDIKVHEWLEGREK